MNDNTEADTPTEDAAPVTARPAPKPKNDDGVVVLGATMLIILFIAAIVGAMAFFVFALRCAWEAGA